MNLYEELTKNEIELIQKAGVNISEESYNEDDLKISIYKMTDYIMSHSHKNGDIDKLQKEYSNIFDIMERNLIKMERKAI